MFVRVLGASGAVVFMYMNTVHKKCCVVRVSWLIIQSNNVTATNKPQQTQATE